MDTMTPKPAAEAASQPENNRAELARSVRESAQSARRQQTQLIVLGGVWLLAIAGVGYYLNTQLQELSRRNEMVTRVVSALSGRLQPIIAQSVAAEESQRRAKSAMDQGKTSDQDFALLLAQAELDRWELSDSERAILARQRRQIATDNSAPSYFLRGTEFVDYDPKAAIKLFDQAIERDRDYEPAYFGLGKAYSYDWELEKAETALTEAIALEEKSGSPRAPAYAERCWVRMALNMLPQSMEDCNRAAAINSEYWPAYQYRAFTAFRSGDDQRAEADWRKASELRATPGGSLENLGLIYARKGDWRSALDNAETVNLLASDSSWNWLFLWAASDQLGIRERAAEAKAKWVELSIDEDVKILDLMAPENLRAYYRTR